MNNTLPFKNNKRGGRDVSSKDMYNRLNYERKQKDYELQSLKKNADHNFRQKIRNYIFEFAAIATPILVIIWLCAVCMNLNEVRTAIEVLGINVLLLIFGALLGKIL